MGYSETHQYTCLLGLSACFVIACLQSSTLALHWFHEKSGNPEGNLQFSEDPTSDNQQTSAPASASNGFNPFSSDRHSFEMSIQYLLIPVVDMQFKSSKGTVTSSLTYGLGSTGAQSGFRLSEIYVSLCQTRLEETDGTIDFHLAFLKNTLCRTDSACILLLFLSNALALIACIMWGISWRKRHKAIALFRPFTLQVISAVLWVSCWAVYLSLVITEYNQNTQKFFQWQKSIALEQGSSFDASSSPGFGFFLACSLSAITAILLIVEIQVIRNLGTRDGLTDGSATRTQDPFASNLPEEELQQI